MVGQTILGYHVDEKIGSGGFGTVYKVSKTNAAGRYVRALKHIVLPTKKQYTSVLNSMGGDYSKADDYFASVLGDIVNEIRILSDLSESGIRNIVNYYENDIIETPSPKSYDIYILMEYLTPFPDYLESHPFTVRDVIRLGKEMLRALIACHGKNIMHRDIKDDNIFVSGDGTFKLGDFGVSKAMKDKSRAESVKGTPNFIAPEVYLGKEKYDNTVDLYSLGIVLYKLLNKSRNPFMPAFPAPYTTDDEYRAFEQRMTGDTPALPVCAENVLGQAVCKAILPRALRYNNAEEFLAALEQAEASLDEASLATDLGIAAAPAPHSFGATGQMTGSLAGGRSFEDSNETVGSDIGIIQNETMDSHADRNLFETVSTPSGAAAGAPVPPPGFAPRSSAPTPPSFGAQSSTPNPSFGTPSSAPASGSFPTPPPAAPSYIPTPSAPEQVKAIEKKDLKWLLYLSPLLIGGLWVIVYMILIPHAYGKALSTIEWIINDPSAIIDTLKDANNILFPIYKIILLKIYNWLTLAGILTSLFFIGRSLHTAKPAKHSGARLLDKQPHVITIGILEEIKAMGGDHAAKAKQAVYSLCERLKHESAFGEGSDAVIKCENEIAAYLDTIERTVPGLNSEEHAAQCAADIEALCQRCAAKLKVRTELKKK